MDDQPCEICGTCEYWDSDHGCDMVYSWDPDKTCSCHTMREGSERRSQNATRGTPMVAVRIKPVRKHIEHDIQSAFVKAARQIPGCEFLYAIQNAVPVRIRDKEDAKLARIKAQQYATTEGRLPGVLDLCLPKIYYNLIDHVYFSGLYMETKKQGEKLKEEQAQFVLYADSAGYGVAVYRSVQEGIDILFRYLRGEHSNEAALQEAREVLKKCDILQQAQSDLDRSRSLSKRLEDEYGVKK